LGSDKFELVLVWMVESLPVEIPLNAFFKNDLLFLDEMLAV